MKVATRGESQIDYLLPGVQDAIRRLREDAAGEGISTYVRDYGGARTESIVAQLIEWRDEAVRNGEPYYRVSPFKKGKHARGGACDIGIGRRDPATGKYTTVGALPAGMSVAQGYARLGALCGQHGLIWGGTFPAPADVYHFESQQSLAQLDARWAEWIVSPDFPDAPASGAVAIGSSNWQLAATVALLVVAAYLITRKRSR